MHGDDVEDLHVNTDTCESHSSMLFPAAGDAAMLRKASGVNGIVSHVSLRRIPPIRTGERRMRFGEREGEGEMQNAYPRFGGAGHGHSQESSVDPSDMSKQQGAQHKLTTGKSKRQLCLHVLLHSVAESSIMFDKHVVRKCCLPTMLDTYYGISEVSIVLLSLAVANLLFYNEGCIGPKQSSQPHMQGCIGPTDETQTFTFIA